MARDSLAALLRLRQLTLAAARRALADRVTAEAVAVAHVDALDATVAAEAACYRAQPEQQRETACYAAWYQQTLSTRRAAAEWARRHGAATAETRTAMNEARREVRSVETALAHQATRRHAAAIRTEQTALDEAGASRNRKTDKVLKKNGPCGSNLHELDRLG